jgi:osmoprotectant transport system substrate-binding protein
VKRQSKHRLLAGLASAIAGLTLSACGSGTHARRQSTRTTPVATATTQTATTPLPGTGRPAVTIGDKNYGEQFVLGALYSQALNAQGFSTSVNRNIGTTEITLQGLRSGRLDVYPEYLDTWNRAASGDHRVYRSAHDALTAARRHAAAQGIDLLTPTPFSAIMAIAVTPASATGLHLRSIADLAHLIPGATFGGPPQFQAAEPGLATIKRVYGVVPVSFKPLDVGAQIDALDRGTVLAAAVGTTDGQLQVGRYALLDDPRHVFGWGNVVPVVPRRVLLAEGPVFRRTIDAVSALLSTQVMRQLNADVELSGQDPATVARRFLQANGLVPPG